MMGGCEPDIVEIRPGANDAQKKGGNKCRPYIANRKVQNLTRAPANIVAPTRSTGFAIEPRSDFWLNRLFTPP